MVKGVQGMAENDVDAETNRLAIEAFLKQRLPKRHLGGFDTLRPMLRGSALGALEAAELWADGFDPNQISGWFVGGATGTGKTGIAAGICRRLVERGFRDSVWWSWPALLRRIRDSYHADSRETEGALLRECVACACLVLDDLGAERPTEHSIGILYHIVNERCDGLKPLIVTSNLDGKRLREFLGQADAGVAERIVSRLAEMCIGMSLDGSDLRLRKGATNADG